ncbi:CHAT domain-containing protein [Chitinophaga filiformis]|uniref:CHAT domain-containing protein n=1 Tax=Chitinophaga filiformis TaxID=104663 RepID=UPI001F3DD905|nr:CHAT domain-containing protein [Chitinophaga filiformis]MCF6405864.1 CHAT domain-containing protein [Chitinophaga filiformis]
MPDISPYFIFAFADPVGDLKFIADEEQNIDLLLAYERSNNVLGFHRIPKATGPLIIRNFEQYRQHEPCFFHFSGHASHIGLHLGDGHTQSALALSAILTNNSAIKVLFLNACSSATLVRDILEQTGVEAVIATRTAVYDELAAKVSLSFYEHFVVHKRPLQEAYNYLYADYEQTCVEKKGPSKKLIGEMDDELKALDKTDKFAWGLFTKNTEILNASICNIRARSQVSWTENEARIQQLEEELKEEEEIMEEARNAPKSFERAKKNVERIMDELKELRSLRTTVIQTNIAKTADEILKEDQSVFESALKSLNYIKQRGVFKLNGKPIGGLVMSGDRDSVLDLLYYHLLFENKVYENNQLTFPFDPASSIYDEFWIALIKWLHLTNINADNVRDQDKKEIVRYLIRDKFCGGVGIAHQDIVFKIICSNKDLSRLELTLDEFGRYWDSCIADLKLTTQMQQWRHKVLFFLIDEMEMLNEDRMKTFKETIAQLQQKGRFNDCLQVLTPVDRMTENDLERWLESQPQLGRIGLNATLAKEIFQQSNGTIRQILKILKSKVNFEVPFITRFQIN